MSALHNATNGQTSGGLAELSKLFICPLCHRFFNQALELQCGHVFCDSCVDQHFSPNGRKYFSPLPSCPTCNLSTPTCVRSVFLDRVVASLVPPAMPVGTLLSSNLSAASSGSERARLEQLVAARGLTIQFRRTGDLSLQSLVAVECVVSGQRIGTAEGSDEAEAIELLARKIMHTWQGGSAPAPSSILVGAPLIVAFGRCSRIESTCLAASSLLHHSLLALHCHSRQSRPLRRLACRSPEFCSGRELSNRRLIMLWKQCQCKVYSFVRLMLPCSLKSCT